MFKIHKEEIEINGKKVILETGKIARQADGAIIATCGETVVIATVVGAKKLRDGQDFFPLSVNYQEKYYAAGKIPGGYFKREARPTESEQLISRLIDRPIRPLFPSSFMNEVQLLPTVLSYDGENQADVLSIIACSAALAISGLPFGGPIAASRVGFKDGKYLLNPTPEELEESSLDLVVAGTKDAVLMVESEASGLSNSDLSLSNYVLQIPTSKKFKSLNLSHSLTVICYEIFKLINFKKFEQGDKSLKISSKSKISSLLFHLEKLLNKKGFFVPFEKKHSMIMNINNLFYRLEPNDKEVRILASIISSLSKKNINHN